MKQFLKFFFWWSYCCALSQINYQCHLYFFLHCVHPLPLTEPETVRNLSVTEITTSSVSLNWTKPEGQSSFYRVQWTDGNVTKNDSVNETYVNISELTAGEQYTFSVMTVAGDQKTVGEAKTVSLFTSKMSSDILCSVFCCFSCAFCWINNVLLSFFLHCAHPCVAHRT